MPIMYGIDKSDRCDEMSYAFLFPIMKSLILSEDMNNNADCFLYLKFVSIHNE